MTLAFALLATFLPWIMGFAIVKPLLRKRYGYRSLAWGLGCPIGWMLNVVLIRGYDYYLRPLDVLEILVIQAIVTVPLLFLSSKRCSMDDQRFEKSSANVVHFATLVLLLLLIYRWIVMGLSLLGGKDVVIDSTAISQNEGFVTMIEFYMSLTWGTSSLSALPWLSVAIASVLVIFGGLRYLGVKLLPALLSAYALASMPLLDINITSNAEGSWTGVALLCITLVTIIALTNREWRLLLLIPVLLATVWFGNPFSLVFLFGLAVAITWYFSNFLLTVLFSIVATMALYMTGWLHDMLSTWLPELSKEVNLSPLFLDSFWQYWMFSHYWHYLFVVCIFSLLLLMIQPINVMDKRFSMFLVVAVFSCVTALFIITSIPASAISPSAIADYFNRLSLYFVPILVLIPVSVYQLTVTED